MRFMVNPSVLVPRPDTETLVEAALQTTGTARSALDLCTGSGAVAIALKRERPALTVTASDISPAALEAARTNAENLHTEIRFVESDLFDRVEGCFDLIVSNPPYIPTAWIASLAPEVQKEPRLALDGGGDGLDLVKKIILGAKTRLNPGGMLLMEADSRQMPAIGELLRGGGYQKVRAYRDLAGLERVIGGVVGVCHR
jgi:release factor glutamine methyltransferase